MDKIKPILTLEGMRKVGKLSSKVLDMIEPYVIAGITTNELDIIINDYIIQNGAISACIGYHGYSKYTCISVNHVACHGVPGAKKLKNGDIVNIDVTLILNGLHGDTSRMYTVGKISVKANRICKLAKNAMYTGISIIRPGVTTGDIGYAIGTYCNNNNVTSLRQYCGHGIGTVFHGALQTPSYGMPGTGDILKIGDFITIEPILTLGKEKTHVLTDGWTVVTNDRALTAQWEHTIAVIDNGYEILTVS